MVFILLWVLLTAQRLYIQWLLCGAWLSLPSLWIFDILIGNLLATQKLMLLTFLFMSRLSQTNIFSPTFNKVL